MQRSSRADERRPGRRMIDYLTALAVFWTLPAARVGIEHGNGFMRPDVMNI